MDGAATRGPKALKGNQMYLASLMHGFANWRRYRIAVRQLADLDDRSLRDIGLTRGQIKKAVLDGR